MGKKQLNQKLLRELEEAQLTPHRAKGKGYSPYQPKSSPGAGARLGKLLLWGLLLVLLANLAGAYYRYLNRTPPTATIAQQNLGASRRDALAPTRPAPAVASAAPNLWDQENNRAVALLGSANGDLARLTEAALILERCLAAEPDNLTFKKNLAEALVRWSLAERDHPDADQKLALTRLIRAGALAPEREDIQPLIERWRRELSVEEGFAGYGSLYFQLRFDGEHSELLNSAHVLTALLDETYGDYREFFQHDPVAVSGTQIRVVIYSPEAFHRVTGLGHWAGGAFDGSVRVPIRNLTGDRPRWERTLRHELVHAFLDSLCGDGVPGWLNEGLAQWQEGDLADQLEAARQTLGQPPLQLAELRGNLGQIGEPQRIAQAYAQALLFTDFLIKRYGEWTLARLLSGIGTGQSDAAAFAEAAGLPLEEAHAFFLEGLAD
jgi:hypothetical protein